MKKIPVIIDTDPGVDDAVALFMCLSNESLDVKCITTVGGNVELKYTSQNAKDIVKLAKKDVQVSVGAQKPLYKKLVTAAHIHGEKGMGQLVLDESNAPFKDTSAIESIYNEAMACKGQLRLLGLGPLTNIANAIKVYPDIKDMIHSIVVMGGTIGLGNVTPAAEFNIFVDPDAAKIVFDSGIRVTMVGLNVTNKTIITKEQNKVLMEINNPVANVVANLNSFAMNKESVFNPKGAIMHDPLAAAVLIDRSVITTEHFHVDVECESELTRGATVVNCYRIREKTPNVHVAMASDSQRFFDILLQSLKNYK